MPGPRTLVAAAAAILLGTTLAGSGAARSTATYTFNPTADAYVDSASPAANAGSATALYTDASPQMTSYLRFTLTGLGGPVSKATLRVYAATSGAAGQTYDVRKSNDTSWSESAITAADAPQYGPVAGTAAAPVVGGTWTSVDVTQLVTGNGAVTLVMTSSGSTRIRFASRETTTPPELVVETQTGTPPPGSAPANTTAPTISGTAQQGQTLTASPGSWTGTDPITYTYQWQRCGSSCANIGGATGTTYVAASADVGKTILVVVTGTNSVGSSSATSARTATVQAAPPPSTDVLLAAGDIASCASSGDEATGGLIQGTPGASVLTLGDNVYENGTAAQFANCYGPSWGQFLDRTHPAVGNHDYLTANASAYFSYFGAAAGPPSKGYYSFDVGSWHLVSINSNCSKVGGCAVGSPQETWLRSDLATHPARCTLAFWHHPRFSSGQHGNFVQMQAIWDALYAAGADIVLSGHDHDYERFAPQTPSGALDPARGIREFIVGTGGKNHYRFVSVQPNSEVRNDVAFGVLELTLRPTGYDWRFVPVAGATFTDSGSGSCH